ncbi:hypothetical protein CBI38_15440 [Rhodococcus oxybenzonivorans]|uniref:Uncharacterized protein n=1 Tax=Rhodococcus oxybenzonivorans TaxID=1990687 RepID=A0A2S2BW56_9NOCA|nr:MULTISPECIES: hypothetical protein [Rhodococcus]AWK72748.1 hypothetical protein CBI38_15440 [Rhodococcus oxybenzonivorans]QTJ69558.1 hypothetical protein HYG77_31205 [Rhodococcus sp. ZPP]
MTTSSFCRNGLRRTTRRGASLGDRLHSGALSGRGDAFRTPKSLPRSDAACDLWQTGPQDEHDGIFGRLRPAD